MTLKFVPLKFITALLTTTFFAASAFAQSTPIPKGDANPHAGHDHGGEAPEQLSLDDVPFALSEAPDDHVIGSDTAPITMIGYFSVTCPHCSDWFTNEWPSVKKELVEAGKMRFILRELPTAPAQLSMIGFMMAECAPAEDYYKVIEYQMENQKQIFKQAPIKTNSAIYILPANAQMPPKFKGFPRSISMATPIKGRNRQML